MRKGASVVKGASRYLVERGAATASVQLRMQRSGLALMGFLAGVICAGAFLAASAAVGSGFGGL